jgi:integrase
MNVCIGVLPYQPSAGLPDAQRFRLHDLRHAFANAKLREGWDVYDLMHHTGHSSIKVTERYLGYGARKRSAATRVAQKVTHSASGVTQQTVIDDDSQ